MVADERTVTDHTATVNGDEQTAPVFGCRVVANDAVFQLEVRNVAIDATTVLSSVVFDDAVDNTWR